MSGKRYRKYGRNYNALLGIWLLETFLCTTSIQTWVTFFDVLQKLSLNVRKVEHFTIEGTNNDDFKSFLVNYDEMRTGVYTNPESMIAKSAASSVEAALKDGVDFKTLLTNIPSSDIESFIRNFE